MELTSRRVSNAPKSLIRAVLETHWPTPARQTRPSGQAGRRQPLNGGGDTVDCPHRCALARPPGGVRKWNTVYQRFRRWSRAGVLSQLFYVLTAALLDLRTVMVDGTFVTVHQHAAGSPKEIALPVVKPLAAAVGG